MVAGSVPLVLYVGQLDDPLADLLSGAATYTWQVAQGIPWPDTVPLQAAWTALGEGTGTLVARLYAWSLNLVNGQPLLDPMPSTLL